MMEFDFLPPESTIHAEDIEQGVQSFWEGLKETLNNELTHEELENVIFLMGERIEMDRMLQFETPSDLLDVLEQNMFIEDALSILEHTLSIMDQHPEYGNRSFGEIIRGYMISRKRFECPNIIGRDKEIRTATKLLEKSTCKGLWIHGQGGLGKTVFANEICARLFYSKNKPVIIFDLKQVRSSGDFLRSLLSQFNVHIIQSDIRNLTSELIYQLKTIAQDTHILLDNIEDVYESSKDEIHHILQRCMDSPSYMPIKWLVTSRIEMGKKMKLEGIEQLQLQPLTRQSAETLLRLSFRPKQITETQCKIFLDITGEVPLAIRLLSSTAKRFDLNGVPDDQLRSLLNAKLQNHMTDCIEYTYRALSDTEKHQLSMLSVVKTSQFDIKIVKAVLEIADEEAVYLMMKLTNRQIIQRVCTKQKDLHYCFHPLIFEYTQNIRAQEETLIRAQHNFCKHMLERIKPSFANTDTNYMQTMATVSANAPLLKVLCRVLSTGKTDVSDLLGANENIYLFKLQEMIQLTQLEKDELFNNITEQMKRNNNQSYVFWKLEEIQMMIDCKRFCDAEEGIKLLEDTHLNEGKLSKLSEDLQGRCWFVKGRFLRCKSQKELSDAIHCFKKSLEIYENTNNTIEASRCLNALGNAYFDNNDFDKALVYHENAAEKAKNFSPDNLHPDLAVFEFNVGTIYLAKARQELSGYQCATEETHNHYEQALRIFEASMRKDDEMGTNRMPKYADKLSQKASCLFHLNRLEEAISDMKRSLEIKITPFQAPDENITLAYFKTGRTFISWRADVLHSTHKHPVGKVTDRPTKKSSDAAAKQLLKEAVSCFQCAEMEIRSDGMASLKGKDKSDFIKMYKQIASPSLVHRERANEINKFCKRFEDGLTLSSSSSSSVSTSSEEFSQEHSESDEGMNSDDMENCPSTCIGIPSTETEKQEALRFEQEIMSEINAQTVNVKNKKRRHSSGSD